MSKTIALIGAGYTLQKFKQQYGQFNFHETHRDTLEAGPDSINGDLSFLNDCDALIFSLPPSTAALNLVRHVQFHKRAILLSSIGVYAKSDGIFDESGELADSDRAKLIASIENEFLKLHDSVVLRLGGLFDEQRHPINSLIKKQRPIQGAERINFVHIDDVCEALSIVITNMTKNSIYNLVDRNHPTRKDYYSSLTDQCLNFVDDSRLNYQVSSSRFLDEFETTVRFLNRINLLANH